MLPELFGIAPSYAVFLVAGDVVGVAVATYGAWRAGLDPKAFVLALLALTVAALVGAKLYGLIENGARIGPLSMEIWSGYRYPGSVVAVTAALLGIGHWSRIRAATLADIIAPAFGFAMSVVRIGCLLAGCCSGSPSSLPWAIRFPAHSIVWGAQVRSGILTTDAVETLPVHPLQIYFGLFSLSLGVFCLWFEHHKKYDGQVFLAYVTLYGLGQFLLEFLRFAPLPYVQYMALAIALAAGSILMGKASAVERSTA